MLSDNLPKEVVKKFLEIGEPAIGAYIMSWTNGNIIYRDYVWDYSPGKCCYIGDKKLQAISRENPELFSLIRKTYKLEKDITAELNYLLEENAVR